MGDCGGEVVVICVFREMVKWVGIFGVECFILLCFVFFFF